MIIKYKNKKIIFVHIQKSGGTSVLKFFKNKKNHNKIKDDIKYLKNKKENINNYFKFTIVRNPWDRIVSFYHYHKQKLIKGIVVSNTWKYIKNLKFHDFLKSHQFQKWASRNNIVDYITYKDKIYIDYFINFEKLKDDFEIIKKIADKHGVLPVTNKSKHHNYEKYYDKKSKKIISDLFQREINFFNFKFGKKINLKNINKNIILD